MNRNKFHYEGYNPCYKHIFYIERDMDITPSMVWITPDHMSFWNVAREHIHAEEDCIKLKFIDYMKSL